MATLNHAHEELFRRTPDECFPSLASLIEHCGKQQQESLDRWERPQNVAITSDLTLGIDDNPDFRLNDWSFSQLCRMAGVSKDTVNRLSPKTASHVFRETMPHAEKPMQMLTTGETVRSVHGVSYTRLWNTELLQVVQEFATGFQPPQEGATGGTGLYCGEQDIFLFLIDPAGWTEIKGEAFAPGVFLWNSEVGRRSLGIQTFWFQKVCANHLVWDAVEVIEFTRKHTANVRKGLDEIRRLMELLVTKRDARRDGFAKVMRKAMAERLGTDADEAAKELSRRDIPRHLVTRAMDIAKQQGEFTIYSLVDALTRSTQSVINAGDRTELDSRIGRLLTLAV